MSQPSGKLLKVLETLQPKFGEAKRNEPAPPANSADAEAVAAVARKNSQIVAEVVLGLHGHPNDGIECAKRLMTVFVDWNEVRVGRTATLVRLLGRMSRAEERIILLKRFLESFFLRRRNLQLEYLFTLRVHECRRFLENLAVFERHELPVVMAAAFRYPGFPPDENILRPLRRTGIVPEKTTALQMVKLVSKGVEEEAMFQMYANLYGLARAFCSEEKPDCKRCLVQSMCPASKGFLNPKKPKPKVEAKPKKKAEPSAKKKVAKKKTAKPAAKTTKKTARKKPTTKKTSGKTKGRKR